MKMPLTPGEADRRRAAARAAVAGEMQRAMQAKAATSSPVAAAGEAGASRRRFRLAAMRLARLAAAQERLPY